MNLRQRFAEFGTNRFVRSVGVLVGGTAFGHAITMLALPVVTRLYTPSDFSVLAVFTAVVAMVSVAACLRFDVAIPIPQSDGDAINVLGLALTCTLAVSVVLAACVLGAPDLVVGWLHQPELVPHLWLLPIGVMLAGAYSALQFWFVRKKEFASIARTRIAQSSACAGAQIGLGGLGLAPLGLLLGLMLNTGAGCVGLGYRLWRTDGKLLRALNWPQMRALFSTYQRFPKYSTLEALCNSASMQIPIIMIAALASGPEAGFLVLAMYAMQAPMALIGNAVAQVYMSRAPEEHRSERLGSFTVDVFGGLLKTGVGPLLLAAILAPELFALVFGQEWRRAGVLVSWMAPWFVMQFLSTPVSMALHVTGHQRAALVLQWGGLVIRVAAVYAASLLARDFVSEAYALSGGLFYLIYLAVLLRLVSAPAVGIAAKVRDALPVICVGGVAGSVAALALHVLRLAVL